MKRVWNKKHISVFVAICLCLSMMPLFPRQDARADGTDGVTVTKVASESDLTVGSLYAFTPTWQSDSTLTPYGSYEYKSWIDSENGGWYDFTSAGSGVNITNVGTYRGKQVNLKINIDKLTAPDLETRDYTFYISSTFNNTILPFCSGNKGANLTFSFYYNDGSVCNDLYFYMLVWSMCPEKDGFVGKPEKYTFPNDNGTLRGIKYCYADYSISGNVRTLVAKGTNDDGISQKKKSAVAFFHGSSFNLEMNSQNGWEMDCSSIDKEEISCYGEVYDNKTKKVLGTTTKQTYISNSKEKVTITIPTTLIPNGYNQSKIVSATLNGTAVSNPTFSASASWPIENQVYKVYVNPYFDITTSATNGTITSSGQAEYQTSKTVSYAPKEHYHLKSVTVDGEEVDITKYPTSYTFSNVSEAHTISVVNEIDKFDISTSVTNGTITPSSVAEYGTSKTIDYVANVGYHLASVVVDGETVDITKYPLRYTFSDISENHSIDVRFEIDTFPITTSVLNGNITQSCIVDYGSSKQIAYAPQTGYHLTRVKVDGVEVDISKYPLAFYFEDIKAAHTVDAVFEINTYKIDTSVENGTISDSNIAVYGSWQTVEYAPDEGYHIAHVIVDGEEVDITEHPTSYTFENITSEHTIDVKYEIDTFDITTSVENGTITASQTVDWGSSMKIEYSPKEDYHLVSVNVDGQDIDIDKFPTRYYVMFEDIDTNHTVDVKYSIDTYSIFTNIENGSITESCEVEVGSNKTIEFSPTFGYHITKVTVDGDDVDFLKLNGKLTFNDVQENHSVNVICEKDKDIVETISNALPKTGSDLFLWVIVLGFVGTFSIAIAVYSRKLKHKEKKAE